MKKFFILLLFYTSLHAQVTIHNENQLLDYFELSYYYDENKTETIESIQNIKFTETTPNWFTFGLISGNTWFKLTIHNKSKNNEFVFQLIEPFYQRVHFYNQINGKWQKQYTGLKYYERDRNEKHLTPMFKFSIEANATKTIYIQFAPDKETAGFSYGRFQLTSQSSFNTQSILSHYLFYFFFLGSMFLLFLFNLFLLIKFRDIIYFYYTIYIFFFSIYLTIYSGLIHYFGLSLWYRELILSMPIFLVSLMLFSDKILRLNHYLPYVHKILIFTAWVYLLSMPYLLYDYSSWMKTFGIATAIFGPIVIFSSIYVAYRGHKEAKLYFIGAMFYISSLTILPLMARGILPHTFFTHYSFSVLSYLEIMFFSFILVKRFYTTQSEKIKLQSDLLEIQKNNEKILEERVKRRTNKINQLLKEKEVLLKEVYHRVKNNFQMVVSLLWIENENKKSQDEDDSLLELINRIKSMALIHQYLLGMDDYAEIRSHEYLHQINLEIQRSYTKTKLQIHDEIDDFSLSPDHALALGIIVNELLTNAVKHFKRDETCTIELKCQNKESEVFLSIQDNGEGFDLKKRRNSFGLKLIKQFAKKLHATKSEFSFERGTRYELVFTL
jgi:two-component sensor histidine kinase